MPRFTLILLLVGSMTSLAHADRCGGKKEAEARSRTGQFSVKAKRADDGTAWQAALEDRSTKQVTRGSLGEQSFHSHLEILISNDGSRIVVFEPSASDREGHCVQVFDRDLKLLKEFALKDLLTKKERAAVQESTSHYTFTSNDPEKGVASWLEDDGKTFVFHEVGGRRVRVSLDPSPVKP